MHTFEKLNVELADGSRVDVRIHHNGSYTGDVLINVDYRDRDLLVEARLPCEALVAFARNAQLERMIDTLERALG